MQSRRRGFTFIEITLVITIMAVLAAIALPRMKGTMKQAQLKRTAREVVGMLRYARNVAVLRELPCEVRFDLEGGVYQLVLLDDDMERVGERARRRNRRDERDVFTQGEDVGGLRRLDDVFIPALYSAATLTEDTDNPRVIYYPDGSATPATIVLQDDTNQALHVVIYRTTGMARVQKGSPAEEPEAQTRYYGPKRN